MKCGGLAFRAEPQLSPTGRAEEHAHSYRTAQSCVGREPGKKVAGAGTVICWETKRRDAAAGVPAVAAAQR